MNAFTVGSQEARTPHECRFCIMYSIGDLPSENFAADPSSILRDEGQNCPVCVLIIHNLKRDLLRIRDHKFPDFVCNHCILCLEEGNLSLLGYRLREIHKSFAKVLTEVPFGCPLCAFFLRENCLQKTDAPASSQGSRVGSIPSKRRRLAYNDNIVLLSEHGWHFSKAYLLHELNQIRPVKKSHIHWPLVKSWLRACETAHGHNCNFVVLKRDQSKMRSMVLIDVNRMRLVEREYGCRYITLSYVWGNVAQLQLTKANTATLFEDGSLNLLQDQLPQVVKDAINAVTAIGEYFLWVDTLCITQDDESVKHHLLQEMASIYHHALITLIALHGQNAQAGLPGVSPETRCFEPFGVHLGVHIAARRSFAAALSDSVYEERAWTLQERYLSRRRLYFTGSQVVFACNSHSWQEDRYDGPVAENYKHRTREGTDSSPLMAILSRNTISKPRNAPLEEYVKIVEVYSSKQLTFASDVLNAFAGIGNLFEQVCGWTFVKGLPERWFDHALLWEQKHTTERRFMTAQADIHTQLTEEFPTWSWAAWKGGITYSTRTLSSTFQPLHSQFFISGVSGIRKINYLRDSAIKQREDMRNKEYVEEGNIALTEPSLHKHHSSKLNTLLFLAKTVSTSRFRFRIPPPEERESKELDSYGLIVDSKGDRCGKIPGVDSSFLVWCSDDKTGMVLLGAYELYPPHIYGPSYSSYLSCVLTMLLVVW